MGTGALDRASPNFMGLASLGLDVSTFYDFSILRSPIERVFGARFLRASPIPAAGGHFRKKFASTFSGGEGAAKKVSRDAGTCHY